MPERDALIRERYLRTLETIASAARKSGRTPEAVRLVVVTKAQPLEVVQAAVQAGAHWLGENYAEEAADKIAAMGSQSAVEWHMIGHVQSRKARLVARDFELVHSLDSLKLARRLDAAAGALGRTLSVLLEFNLGGEESKHGWPAQQDANWMAVLPEVEETASLAHLEVRGLMTMPPLSTDPEASRPYFAKLRRLQEFLSQKISGVEWAELSMGTSADYPVAVEEGATLVRVGQAVVGPRPGYGD